MKDIKNCLICEYFEECYPELVEQGFNRFEDRELLIKADGKKYDFDKAFTCDKYELVEIKKEE